MQQNCWEPSNTTEISIRFSDLYPPTPRILELDGHVHSPSRRRRLVGARGPGSRRRPQLPVRAAQRRQPGLADAERGRRLDLGTKGRGRTPWSRTRTGHGRLALKGGAREVLAAGTLEALGATASRSISQAVRDGRGALANSALFTGRAAMANQARIRLEN
ncbi:protein adenylyltransferase SelO family protein [Sorangium sp. So ce1128]